MHGPNMYSSAHIRVTGVGLHGQGASGASDPGGRGKVLGMRGVDLWEYWRKTFGKGPGEHLFPHGSAFSPLSALI